MGWKNANLRSEMTRLLRRAGVSVFGDNYFSALATITIPFDEVQESSVFESVVVVGDPLWARFAASKR
jgi:hypothetical protein